MAKIKVRYLEEYRDGYRYRRRVPDDLRDKIGKGSWTHNFPTRTPDSHILAKAKSLALEHDREIAVAKGQELSPAQVAEVEAEAQDLLATKPMSEIYGLIEFAKDHGHDSIPRISALISAFENRGRVVAPGLALTAVVQRDKEVHSEDRDTKPLNYALNSFVDTIGDKPISHISRIDVGDWLAALARRGQSPSTIRRRIGALRAVVNRYNLDLETDGRNPFERHRIKGSAATASDRLPFNKAMLARIDHHLAANNRVGHETKNVLRIMRNTGAGPGEVGGLALADVILDGEAPYIWIRPNSLRGVKADDRDRQVPLIGEALEAARDAVKRAKVRSKRKSPDMTPLFSGFGRSGRGADSLSAKLNKCLRSAGVPKSPRLTCYSFRHTVKEAMRSATVADHVQRRVLGHTGAGVADRYGSPRARRNEAREALERALEHLGDVDSSIYSTSERIE